MAFSIGPPSLRASRWQEINDILKENKGHKKRKVGDDGEKSTPYSAVTWNQLKGVFDRIKTPYIQPRSPVPEDNFNFLVRYIRTVIKCYGSDVVSGNEAKRIHLIAPVIFLVVSLLDGVTVEIEEDMEGSILRAHGHFEFVIRRGDKRVCIVEAKEHDMKKGMVQDLLGCEVVSEKDSSSVVYGIVTNFDKWIFLKSCDDKIEVDQNEALGFEDDGSLKADELLIIVEKIYGMLM